MAQLTQQIITLTNSGGTFNIDPTNPPQVVFITGGTITLSGNVVIDLTGIPADGTAIRFILQISNINLNGHTFDVTSKSYLQEELVNESVLDYFYANSTAGGQFLYVPSLDNTDSLDGASLIDDSVTKEKINADVAGSGLGQNVDGSLEVNVDGSTIEISADTLRVKDAGITAAKIATAVAGAGLAGGGGSALSVNVDSSTIEINVDTLRIKDDGVTNAKLATMTGDSVKTADGSGNPQDTVLATNQIIANIGSGVQALDLIDSDLDQIKTVSIPVSFEASEQGDNEILMPDGHEILYIWGCVTKAIAGTDNATVTVKISDVGVTNGVLTFSPGAAINSTVSATPTANNEIGSTPGSYQDVQLVSAKATAGGKAMVTMVYKRF